MKQTFDRHLLYEVETSEPHLGLQSLVIISPKGVPYHAEQPKKTQKPQC